METTLNKNSVTKYTAMIISPSSSRVEGKPLYTGGNEAKRQEPGENGSVRESGREKS